MEYQNNYTNPNDYYDKNMCIRSMTNMIAKTKEITKYGSILNMGVSRTNHVKHSSNEHGHYLTNHETLSML